MTEAATWRRCSACKKPIPLGATYWVCNVSTCNQKRTGLSFCTVGCWEVHLPSARHREAWALERTAPTTPGEAEGSGASTSGGGTRRLVRGSAPRPSEPAAGQEVLVIASRVKEYVRAKSGFNTSDRVLEPLSDIVRRVCDEAIRNARKEGRRTVLDRDVPDSD